MSDFKSYFPEMRINIYYQANRFFLEDDQIINNAEVIKDIPTTLIHGARDVICPPVLAWKLHQRLANSSLNIVADAGHLSSEPGIKRALLEAVDGWN